MKILRPFFLIIFPVFLFGQEIATDTSDTSLWSYVGIEYELNKKWNFSLEEQIRWKQDVSIIDRYFTEFTTRYKFIKKMDVGLGFRYTNKNDTEGNIQGFEKLFRINADISYKHKINRFSFKHRFSYQSDKKLGLDEKEASRKRIRFKSRLLYNIKQWKWDPKFSVELFSKKNNTSQLQKYRLTLATSYKFKGIGHLDFFYRYENNSSKVIRILGVGCVFTIK